MEERSNRNCSCTTESKNPRGMIDQQDLDERDIRIRMSRIKHKVLVMSGKGGVGKSAVAVNVAMSLALAGKKVGLLDVDIHGPSVPKILGLENRSPIPMGDSLQPVDYQGKLKVMSLGFMLEGSSKAVIWRGPMKMGMIMQFLKDVEWGELDFLVVDLPPGTGDEPLSTCQLIENPDGAIIVTTPQEVAIADVRRSINFCHQMHVPVIGVVENMSGFACPHCGKTTDIFNSGAGERMASEMKVPFLGRIGIDPEIARSCDAGQPYVSQHTEGDTAKAFAQIVAPILEMDSEALKDNVQDNSVNDVAEEKAETSNSITSELEKGRNGTMKIAIPMSDGKLTMHFGHCAEFTLVDIDTEKKVITGQETISAPPHQPGLLPTWLAERKVNTIIAGGMGSRAQDLFETKDIHVVVGAPCDTPEVIVQSFMDGTLKAGQNVCDH